MSLEILKKKFCPLQPEVLKFIPAPAPPYFFLLLNQAEATPTRKRDAPYNIFYVIKFS